MRPTARWAASTIENEFATASLGDERRKRRLQLVAKRAMGNPAKGLPQMVASDAVLEGVYRLLNNKSVAPEAVLEPHIRATFERARELGTCLVVHDTTDLEFRGESPRKGLGLTVGKTQGFQAHVALAVMPGEARVPLGVCGVLHVRRLIRKHTRKQSWWTMSKDPNRESLRWHRLFEAVEERRQGFSCIHVMDREGDMYDLLAIATRRGARFVIRAAYDRAL